MSDDEVAIRDLVALWRQASAANDTATVLGLMTDDAVFLVPGRPPMNKAEFAALSTPPAGTVAPKMESSQRICELVVCGEIAWMWSELAVSVLPAGAAGPVEREGHTLTVFRKQNGSWKLARDANLLAPRREASPAPAPSGPNLFDHVVFGVSDYAASKAFFLKALQPLGVTIAYEGPLGLELCRPNETSSLCLRLTPEPRPAPLHLAFQAASREQVQAFYAAALAAGGKDNGAPGLRPQYHPNYYGAFVIGPDGHNVEAVCHKPA